MSPIARSCQELTVYQAALSSAMNIFTLTKSFPREERYSMVDQMRRASRSVCANIAEGWRKRRYPAAFIAKISDAESEASEVQVWLELAHRCGYLSAESARQYHYAYDAILAQLVRMIQTADQWAIKTPQETS